MIANPGIHEIRLAAYFADPCPVPSLSHSIARKLIAESPLHAWHAHPRLNPAYAETPANEAMDIGSIVHKFLLGKGADIAIIEGDDWRTKAAREARDEARAEGLIPVLDAKMPEIEDCYHAIKQQLKNHPDCAQFFAPGQSEAVMAWRDGETWFRGMVDRLPDDPRAPVFDLKTTALSANPEEWQRRLVSAYATQAAFYQRGLRAIRGVRPGPFLFIVAEVKPPYAVSVMACAPSLLAVADAQIDRAIRIWRQCMASDRWPGYPAQTAHVEAPAWLLGREADGVMARESAGAADENDEKFLEELFS